MKVLVTGADGFIGKNLVVRLSEDSSFTVLRYVRGDTDDCLRLLLEKADVVIHLAGENRPRNPNDFEVGNAQLTEKICAILLDLGLSVPFLLASSTQASRDNDYGKSKKRAEDSVSAYSGLNGASVAVYRLPGVFGKWCRPNYNSVVATFCNNVAKNLPICVSDPRKLLTLNYIDDVIDSFIGWLSGPLSSGVSSICIESQYEISLGDLAQTIQGFPAGRSSLVTERVGTGLLRALYSTYISYLSPAQFKYDVPSHADNRGVFVEMLKTQDSGQFSFFTAHPGITRGGHYHHTKTEKFLVIKGDASFRFKHIITGETYTLTTSGNSPSIVETIPGWSHDITNISDEELIVMLWANEIFSQEKPDTIASTI